MVIKDGSAKVTFNDGITGLENVRGWGEFEIEGHNDTATDKEHVGKFTIVSGDKSVDLKREENGDWRKPRSILLKSWGHAR